MPAPKKTAATPPVEIKLVRPSVAFRLKGETKFRQMPGGEIPPYDQWPLIEQWHHTPIPKEFAQQVKWRVVWCGGYDIVNYRRVFHHFDHQPCHCPPGPAIRSLMVTANEIACAGGRGSGKSENTFAFLAKGDPLLPPDEPIRNSYLLCPNYTFLVLRKNAKDLMNNFERAKRFFSLYGGTASENTIRFPSGAYGIWDHVADGDAPDKYQGSEFARIAWEEAQQEQSEENYLKILMSNRSGDSRLRPQIMLTANPGGKGTRWFTARFVRVMKEDGTLYLPGEYIKYDAGDGEIKTRVFIPSTVDDNPYLLRQGYDRQLELLRHTRPALYRRWRLGDFSAVEGAAFSEFRTAPLPGEPPEARHVMPSTKEQSESVFLHPTWPRGAGLDYGYAHCAAIVWGCWTPNHQLHVYREFVKPQQDTVSLGTELALRSLGDLEGVPGHHMTVHLSPDAFWKTDSRFTRAYQIAEGIGKILGPNAVFVEALDEDEERMDAGEAWDSMKARERERTKHTHITLRPARNRRLDGWGLLHDYLRWWRILPDKHEFDEDFARELLLSKGVLAYADYKTRIETQKAEIVPKLLIWSCCQNVIDFFRNAVEKETDHEDVEKDDGNPADDAGDACLGESTQITTESGEILITDVKPGMKVFTRAGYRPVLACARTSNEEPVFEIRFTNGTRIRATYNHPFYVAHRDEFVPVCRLAEDDVVLTPENKAVFVESIERLPVPVPVWNLTVEDQPEYFANGILVHNCRYLAMGFPFSEAQMGRDAWIADKLRKLRESCDNAISATAVVRATQQFEHEFDAHNSSGKGFSVPRRAGPNAWRNIGRNMRVQ